MPYTLEALESPIWRQLSQLVGCMLACLPWLVPEMLHQQTVANGFVLGVINMVRYIPLAAFQDGHSQRAKPRGLSSTVEKTVRRTTRTSAPESQSAAPKEGISSRHGDSASIQESDATRTCSAAEEEEHSSASHEEMVGKDVECHHVGTCSDTSEGEVLPYDRTPADSPPRGSRGQGRPPLSPVRQSLQDLALSRESSPGKAALVPVSIDPVTGMPKPDINVHCNPLFTEPLLAHQQQQTAAAQKQGTGDAEHDAMLPQQDSQTSLTRREGIGKQQQQVPASPPSKLQQSLRALLQQHTQDMQVGIIAERSCMARV